MTVDHYRPIEQLREMAISFHREQMYGDKPYVYHLDMVHDLTFRHGLPVEYQRAAYGHDLLEDVGWITMALLQSWFGFKEAKLISHVSTSGINRKQRTERKIQTLLANPEGINLYMADRIANYGHALRTNNLKKLAMYAEEYTISGYIQIHSLAKKSMQIELSGIHLQAIELLARTKGNNV
jgi:hypothetical protein